MMTGRKNVTSKYLQLEWPTFSPKKLLSNSSFWWPDVMMWLSLYPNQAHDAEALRNIFFFLSSLGWRPQPKLKGVQVGLSSGFIHFPMRTEKVATLKKVIKMLFSSADTSPSKVRNGKLFYVYTQKTTTTLITVTNCFVSSTGLTACGKRKKRALVNQDDLDLDIDLAPSV